MLYLSLFGDYISRTMDVNAFFFLLLCWILRSDFMIEEEIQHLLKYKTQWWNELRAIQKAEKGKEFLKK